MALAVVAVIALVVGSDEVCRALVNHRIARRAGCVLRTTGVTSDVQGLPVLPHLISGNLGTVRIHARHLRRRGLSVDLTASLHDVHTDGRVSGARADARVAYAPLASRLASGASGAAGASGARAHPVVTGDGSHLLIAESIEGGPRVTVSAELTTDGRRISVVPVTLDVLGRELPIAQVLPRLKAFNPTMAARLGTRTVRPHLPAGTVIDAVDPTPSGLVLRARTVLDGPGQQDAIRKCR